MPPVDEKLDSVSRILAHITTDKPVYNPNDVVFIEVYLVDPTTKKPAEIKLSQWDYRLNKSIMTVMEAYADVKILDSFDNEVYSDYGIESKDGTLVFTYKIPKGTSGGEY